MVAVVSLCCVMMFAAGSSELSKDANWIYAQGIGRFLEVIHVNRAFGVAFALMAFTTFVYDTLDVCTRLGRYILQELTGWHGRLGRWFSTGLTAGVPLFFLLRHPSDAAVPVWKLFWLLFGASNQLLAALTLLGVTIWLWRTRRAWWVWLVAGVPTALMYVMSTWALIIMSLPKFWSASGGFSVPTDPVPWIGLVLIVLAALMLIEAIRILLTLGSPPTAKLETAVPAAAAS
jgi:carbon starvation protein